MYGETDSHPSGYGQGNGGFSGTPLWKLKQQNHHQALVQAAQQAYLDEQEQAKADKVKLHHELQKSQRLIIDSVIQPSTTGHKVARNVLVKDLRKVSNALNIRLPTQGVFSDSGQRALFALFDCQAAAEPDPKVAELCCRQLPITILRNLNMLPAENCIPAFVKAALLKTFEDLERDMSLPSFGRQCSAAVVLVVGHWLFSAVLGKCGAVLFKEPAESNSTGAPRHVATPLAAACADAGRGLDVLAMREASSVPEVHGTQLESGSRDPYIVLVGPPVLGAMSVQELMDVAMSFLHRPRATAGEVTAKAMQRLGADAPPAASDGAPAGPPPAVFAAIAAFFRDPDEDAGAGRKADASAAKKPRVEASNMESVRLRQILVRHKDCRYMIDPVKNKPATRSAAEAETLLRKALAELMKDGNHKGDSKWAAQSTPRIMKAIRELSECKSALKAGSQCGDLGWLGKKELEHLGKETFAEPIKFLSIGEWSDVLHSEQGAHLVMRLA